MGIEGGSSSPEAEKQTKIQSIAEGLKGANFLRPNDEEKDKLDDNLSKIFSDDLRHGVDSVAQIDEAIADFETKGAKSSFTEAQIKNLRADREILAEAVTIACRDLTETDPDLESEFFLGPKHIDGLLGEKLFGLGGAVSEKKGVPKEIGVELDRLEMMRGKMKGGSTTETKAYTVVLEKKIDLIAGRDFDGQFETLMALSEELERYENELIPIIDNGLVNNQPPVESSASTGAEMELDPEEKKMAEVDQRAILENRYSKEGGYRSPYETTPDSFVESLMNYEDPRLYFTPPAEWVRKLSAKDRYLLKIQKKLALGAQYNLGVKDISMDKARMNEVYNFPTTELKLLYEMPMMREAMETFWNDLFEQYNEDGKVFTRLKQCRGRDIGKISLKKSEIKKGYRLEIENGYVMKVDAKGGKIHVIDPQVARWLGDSDVGYGFEYYKEERWKRMALSRIFAGDKDKLDRINKDTFTAESNMEARAYAEQKKTEHPEIVLDYIESKKEGDPQFFENYISLKRKYDIEDTRTDDELKTALMTEWEGEIMTQWENEWRRNNSWGGVYDEVIIDYISKERSGFAAREKAKHDQSVLLHRQNQRVPIYQQREDDRTDPEIESEWIVENALQEKRVWATTALLAVVNLDIPSADVYRQLKPSQVMSDKTRTFMMPLEKFVQKSGFRKVEPDGTEEPFGSVSTWAKKQYEIQGEPFVRKVLEATDGDRTEMTDEIAAYRIFPKRVMSGFSDMYTVMTEGGIEMTMSEALLHKRKIIFKGDDLDVFKTLRDPCDELLTVTPLMIGKAEYTPMQQPNKFIMAIEKMRGVNNQINTIRLAKPRINRDGSVTKFGQHGFTDTPEFYAWTIANAIGLVQRFDKPILDMAAMKIDEDTYATSVNNIIRALGLTSQQSIMVKRILSAESIFSSKSTINRLTDAANNREAVRRREERKLK